MVEYNISDLLPQRPPMQFITAIESVDFDTGKLIARVDITHDDLLYMADINGVPSWAALEYMAQSIGCFIGALDRKNNPNGAPAVGFVLGSRKLSVKVPTFNVDESYYVHVSASFCDTNIASFECAVYDKNNNVVADGALNVYRPDDIKKFMEEIHE